MTGTVTQQVDDFHTITPHLVVRDAPRAIEFYTRAFGASELYRNLAPDGKSVMHAELMLGNSRFLLHDEFPDRGLLSPLAYPGTSVTLHLNVDDVDAVFKAAVDAGAETLMPVQDCFWGDRYGILRDPFGHRWSVATRLKDLSPAQIQQQASEFLRSSGASNFSPT
ncbi:MAG TPA: VOC family protein [Planctomycetaceae bacterium]|nr:VOC family protein [Planctomycetaceae bacterium]